MKKNNKTCVCCGEVYTYCNSCPQYAKEPTWKAIFHNDNCRKVFTAVSDYLGKEKTKDEAKAILNQCDLSGKNHFNEKIQETINEICQTDTVDTINEPVDANKKKRASKNKNFDE